MSIFDQPTKTPVQLRYDNIVNHAPASLQNEKYKCFLAYADFWGPKEKTISREDAIALLAMFGKDAANIFIVHSAWQDFIQVCDPTWVRLVPPYPLVFHEDGTVTLQEE